jgi:hypothetical protein
MGKSRAARKERQWNEKCVELKTHLLCEDKIKKLHPLSLYYFSILSLSPIHFTSCLWLSKLTTIYVCRLKSSAMFLFCSDTLFSLFHIFNSNILQSPAHKSLTRSLFPHFSSSVPERYFFTITLYVA